jgi:hypothetical protein
MAWKNDGVLRQGLDPLQGLKHLSIAASDEVRAPTVANEKSVSRQ